MLEIARESAKKTHIMYGANLSYTLLVKYLGILMNSRMLFFNEDKQNYILTSKGQDFLSLYKTVKEMRRNIAKTSNNLKEKRNFLRQMIDSEEPLFPI